MKTLKLYWLRFKSKTPQALRNLQKVLLAISLGAGGGIAGFEKFGMADSELCTILKYVTIACLTAIPMLQFATADKQLQDETPDTV